MRSFITSLKSLGPETVPCGVPAPTIVVLDIGNRVSLEKVDKFCYLLDPDGGCDSAVTTRVRSAWKKFRVYLPILTGKGFSLKLKGKVYATCVRSCLMHGSETGL